MRAEVLRRKKRNQGQIIKFSNPEEKGEGEEKILNILCPECNLIPRERMSSDLTRNISPTTSKTFSTANRIFSTISKIFSTSNKIFCKIFF